MEQGASKAADLPAELERPSGARPPARRSVFFLVGSLTGGNLVAMVLRTIGGLILGRLVAPATLGLFNGIGLVLGYAPFLQLGILNGLNRELPFFIGKGERDRAEELATAAQAWALAVGGVTFLALTGVAGWYLAHSEWWRAAGWFTNAIMAVLLFYNTYYLQMTYRTSHDFARLAVVMVVENAALLALLVLVVPLDFYGLCLRVVLAGAISVAILYRWRPIRSGPRWNARHLRHLLIIGLPIFIVGQIYAWWAVLDSTLVLKLAGTRAMGLYAMVTLAAGALHTIPVAVSQVVYPRMSEQYGRDDSLMALIRIVQKPVWFTAAGLIPVIAIGWWLAGPLTRLLVPAYADAVPAMQWALLAPFVSSFQPFNQVFNVARRQGLLLVAILAGMAVYGGSLLWLIRGGVSLPAFPQAMLIGRVVYMLICFVFITYLLRGDHGRPSA